MKYPTALDGDAVRWAWGDVLHLACCDCGLVHDIYCAVNKETDETALVFYRDRRATGQLRRRGFGNLHNNGGKWKLVRNTRRP